MISEFIRNNKFSDVVNPHVKELIWDCLSNLHPVFGCNLEWDNPDNWMLEELEQFSDSIHIDSDSLLNSVKQSTDLMVSSIDVSLLTDITIIEDEKPVVRFDGKITNRPTKKQKLKKTLFKYPDKPLFRVDGELILDQNYYTIPLY